MTDRSCTPAATDFKALLPDAALNYLAHTSNGRGIREIARSAGCHASTILRQVRKTEAMRDDPLVDKALTEVGGDAELDPCPDAVLDAAAAALRHLCVFGALMLYNMDLPQPAIVQTTGEGQATVLGPVALDVAAALVMRGWVTPDGGTSVKRYRITPEGRAALPSLVATRDRRASQDMMTDLDSFAETGRDRRSRERARTHGPGADHPLIALARRRDADGQPFLSPAMVAAGDRLYEDYQVAGFDTKELLGWDQPDVLKPVYERAHSLSDVGQAKAMLRTLDAITDLGPGLSDVVLRCCCLREGLEATEKRMGWSARSGKVVLRIALQRLCRFYAATLPNEGVLVG